MAFLDFKSAFNCFNLLNLESCSLIICKLKYCNISFMLHFFMLTSSYNFIFDSVPLKLVDLLNIRLFPCILHHPLAIKVFILLRIKEALYLHFVDNLIDV